MIDPIVGGEAQVDPGFWLAAANQAIRAECGWHVTPSIAETFVLDGPGGTTLLVPSLRITQITRAVNDGVDVTDQVRFSRRAGVVTLASGWSSEVGAIELDIIHGFDVAEVAEVAGLVVALTKRAAASGAVVQQSIGSASARLATGRDGAVLGVPLLESERAVLAPYRLTWGP